MNKCVWLYSRTFYLRVFFFYSKQLFWNLPTGDYSVWKWHFSLIKVRNCYQLWTRTFQYYCKWLLHHFQNLLKAIKHYMFSCKIRKLSWTNELNNPFFQIYWFFCGKIQFLCELSLWVTCNGLMATCPVTLYMRINLKLKNV